jgi:hypothetical protein
VAWKGEWWKRVERKDADFEHFRTSQRLGATDRPAAVRDDHHARRRGLGDVVHADQPGYLDGHADLFQALSCRRGRRVLIVVYESTGQAPEAIARLDRPASQNDSAIGFNDHGRRYLWVVPEDKGVVWTRFDLAAFDDSRHQRGSAVDAEVTHSGGLYRPDASQVGATARSPVRRPRRRKGWH